MGIKISRCFGEKNRSAGVFVYTIVNVLTLWTIEKISIINPEPNKIFDKRHLNFGIVQGSWRIGHTIARCSLLCYK